MFTYYYGVISSDFHIKFKIKSRFRSEHMRMYKRESGIIKHIDIIEWE
jgi:hypothetical protein